LIVGNGLAEKIGFPCNDPSLLLVGSRRDGDGRFSRASISKKKLRKAHHNPGVWWKTISRFHMGRSRNLVALNCLISPHSIIRWK